MSESRIIKRMLSDDKKYSEKDVVLYLEKFLKPSMSGDSFATHPWGEDVNKGLYVAIFGIDEGQLDKRRYLSGSD